MKIFDLPKYYPNVVKTVIWILFNSLIGFTPLLIMIFVNHFAESETKAGTEIEKLLNEGVLVFFPCILMGASAVDIFNEDIRLKGLSYFALTVTPFILLVFFGLIYTMIACGAVHENFFRIRTSYTYTVTLFSALYCSLSKYYLYKHQDLMLKKQIINQENG